MLKLDDKSLSYRADKQMKLSQNIEFSAILSTLGVCYRKPATGSLAQREQERDRDAVVVSFSWLSVRVRFAVFFAAKIMKRLVSGQSQNFFNI
jgi:hypothetical protein